MLPADSRSQKGNTKGNTLTKEPAAAVLIIHDNLIKLKHAKEGNK